MTVLNALCLPACSVAVQNRIKSTTIVGEINEVVVGKKASDVALCHPPPGIM